MTQSLTDPQPDWPSLLRDVGLRVTQPRLAVLDVVAATPHISADLVTDLVRARLGTVSVQAVYDALNTLSAHAILRKIEPAGSAMRFEIHAADNHHHLICRSCSSIVDVACSVGAMPCALPDDPHGFVVDEAEVTYWGVCSRCRTAP